MYIHAQGCARVWGMRYANECCYMLLWLGLTLSLIRDSWPRSWRGRDEKLRDGEQRQLQSTRRRMWTLRSILGHLVLRSDLHLVEFVWRKSLFQCYVLSAWWCHGDVGEAMVLWWQSPPRHLVVTNKSYKNPQLIRSDSVQNSFSPSWPIVLGLIYSDVTDWACGNWLKKVGELFQKLFAVNWRWYL